MMPAVMGMMAQGQAPPTRMMRPPSGVAVPNWTGCRGVGGDGGRTWVEGDGAAAAADAEAEGEEEQEEEEDPLHALASMLEGEGIFQGIGTDVGGLLALPPAP